MAIFYGRPHALVGIKRPGVPTVTSSPDGTVIFINSGSIVDNSGNVWTINAANNGEAYENGSPPVFSSFAYALYWEGGVIYMQNQVNQWYAWSGSIWNGYFGPLFGGPAVLPPRPAPIQIWDN